MTDEDLNCAEMALSLYSPSGQFATAVALAGRYHQSEVGSISFGEVLNSYQRQRMLDDWNSGKLAEAVLQFDARALSEWARLFLEAEKPRGILIIGDQHFDPLFAREGVPLGTHHPRVARFDPWKALLARTLVARSRIETGTTQKVMTLRDAMEVCPGMCLPKEESVEALLELGWIQDATKDLKYVITHRPIVGGFRFWELIKRERHSHLQNHYDDALFELLHNEANRQVAIHADAID
jgi:hypothetical protein